MSDDNSTTQHQQQQPLQQQRKRGKQEVVSGEDDETSPVKRRVISDPKLQHQRAGSTGEDDAVNTSEDVNTSSSSISARVTAASSPAASSPAASPEAAGKQTAESSEQHSKSKADREREKIEHAAKVTEYYNSLDDYFDHFSRNDSALVWLARAIPSRSNKLAVPKPCRWPKASSGNGGYGKWILSHVRIDVLRD